MKEHTPQDHRTDLQHDAEHERPSKHTPSVVLYLMILFAAAFLLLLMSFLMQNRSNREAMDHLEETSNSAMESLENRLRENEELKAQVAQLEEENDKLTQQVQQADDQARQEQEELTSVPPGPQRSEYPPGSLQPGPIQRRPGLPGGAGHRARRQLRH